MATPTNRSGAIVVGGTAQVLFSDDSGRQGWVVQNLSAGDLFVNDMGVAALDVGFKISAGALFSSDEARGYSCRGALSIWGSITGQKFTAREF